MRGQHHFHKAIKKTSWETLGTSANQDRLALQQNLARCIQICFNKSLTITEKSTSTCFELSYVSEVLVALSVFMFSL